jgi:hypothetical protein
MYLEQLLGPTFPQASFHDATIERVTIDYLAHEAVLDCNLIVGDPGATREVEREARRRGRLTLGGLLYFVIEPPDPTYPIKDAEGLWVASDGPLDELTSRPTDLPDELPEGAFSHWFFIHSWNAFIYVAFTRAAFAWLEREA